MTHKPLRGVNLGGWLLLEKWMTPTLFEGTDAIDEFTFMSTSDAVRKLKTHRDTFISEEDFHWMHDNKVELVRIPVGYWIFEDDGPYCAAIEYLDWAIEMAKRYNLKVVIDLHGLPGSQNGFDHSGKVGKARWFRDSSYRRRSTEVVCQLAVRYREYSIIWGIQVINEPRIGIFHFSLRSYYRKTYQAFMEVARPGTRFIFSDAFSPRLMNGVVRGSDDFPVVMDVHLYHMTTLGAKYRSIEWFFKKTTRRRQLLECLGRTQPIMIGEWSGVLRGDVLKDVAKNDIPRFESEYMKLQLATYEAVEAWCYWNYKTEHPGLWNFRSLVENGDIVINHRG